MTMRYDLVLFDFDGTLADTVRAVIHCIQGTFRLNGLPAPEPEAILPVVGRGVGLHETFRILESGLDDAALKDRVATYRRIYDLEGHGHTRLFPGAVELLDGLEQCGIDFAVISNKGIQALRDSLEHFSLSSRFSLVVGEEPGFPKKPDPAVFHERIEPHINNHDPARILMVGDGEADLIFGKNVGMDTCFVSFGMGSAELIQQHSPTYTMDSLYSLSRLLCSEYI